MPKVLTKVIETYVTPEDKLKFQELAEVNDIKPSQIMRKAVRLILHGNVALSNIDYQGALGLQETIDFNSSVESPKSTLQQTGTV